MTVPWLFQDLRMGQKTGTAIFEHDATLKKVYFKQGDILFASSNKVEDRLGEFLLRSGKISRKQFDAASKVVISTRRQLGAVLFGMGALTAQDLVAQVKLQVKEIILSLFSWREGQYRFDDGVLSSSEIIPLQMSTGNLILDGVQTIGLDIIGKSLPQLKTVIHLTADPLLLFQNADLQPDHRKVLSLIDGNRSMEEISCLSDTGAVDALKALYVLLALRMVEKGEIKSEEEQAFVCEAVREVIVEEDGKQKEEKYAHSITREKLQYAHDSLEHQDFYEVLAVSRGATAHEIRKAYLSLAKFYHPDQHFRPEMHDMKECLESLFQAIHEAYDTLMDERKRGRYNSGLDRGEKKPQTVEYRYAEQPDNRKIAVIQFEKGAQQLKRENFREAEEAFQAAMLLDPENAEYVFHEGLALSRIPNRGRDAEKYFMRAIEMAPSMIEYHLALGQFYVKYGLQNKALSLYQNALKQDPKSETVRQAIKGLMYSR